MRILTLLNRVHYLKSFVYTNERMEVVDNQESLIVEVVARKNSRPICSGCRSTSSIYDHQKKPRRFSFVPLWGIPVYLCYLMRRVDCLRCGVKVEALPWSDGKSPLTRQYQLFLAQWARRLSWQEVARVFNTNWNQVYQSVKRVVEYGLLHRDLDQISAIGVDEIHYGQGQSYLTLVYQLDRDDKRLLYVGKKRTIKSLLRFFWELGHERCSRIEYVCSDMWRPYLKVIHKKIPQALHILDRFHIVALLNKAVDEVRREEVKQLQAEGFEPVLLKSKYCLLKRQENLTLGQEQRLADVLQYDLKSVRAYLLKESFELFWTYTSPYWANWFLKRWCTRAMRSRLKPIKKFVKTVRRHETLMMNWFKAKKAYSSGIVEGLNRRINLVTRKSYGFKSYDVLKIALFHTMGNLPEPEMTHRFC